MNVEESERASGSPFVTEMLAKSGGFQVLANSRQTQKRTGTKTFA